MPYRVEISRGSRAGCKSTECKKEGIKIQTGELRFGTLFTVKEHLSWAYKHWGCVTPQQISNVNEEIEDDVMNLDGYEELPKEDQEKVARAFKQGHVDDDDWNGDVEVNRPGMKGYRVKTPKKKTKQDDDDDMEDSAPESPTKGKTASKKRTKQDTEHEDDEAPKPKKARGKAKKPPEEDELSEAPPPKKQRGKARKPPEEDEESEAPPPKKQRGKAAKTNKEDEGDPAAKVPDKSKAKSKKGSKAQAEAADANEGYTSIFGPQNPTADDAAEGEAEKPKKTRGSKKKANTPAEPATDEPATGKRGAKKKAS